MSETVKLRKPVLIEGRERYEFTYDIDEITTDMFLEAESRALKKKNKNAGAAAAKELDYGLHLYLGYYAVLAINPEISIEDLEQIKGRDIDKFIDLGRDFTMGEREEDSTENGSESSSEATQESSTPQYGNSEEEGSQSFS